MPLKSRDYGFRTSVQIPDDVEKLLQRGRAAYGKLYGYAPSRSAMITMALRSFFKQPDWLNNFRGESSGARSMKNLDTNSDPSLRAALELKLLSSFGDKGFLCPRPPCLPAE